MGLQRTLILSLLLHITFSALLLLSARLQGESGKILNEKVFFVDLKSDAERPPAEVVKDASLKETAVKKILREPAVIVGKRERDEDVISNNSMSDKRETDFAESLSINTLAITEGSDKTFSGEGMAYTNSAHGGEEVIISFKTPGDKKGGLTMADARKLISAAIERAKTYPSMARRRGIEGTVYVSFSIGAEGDAKEIKVVKSSGYKILDETTVKVIKDAAPYPHIDDRVEVPVIYRLND